MKAVFVILRLPFSKFCENTHLVKKERSPRSIVVKSSLSTTSNLSTSSLGPATAMSSTCSYDHHHLALSDQTKHDLQMLPLPYTVANFTNSWSFHRKPLCLKPYKAHSRRETYIIARYVPITTGKLHIHLVVQRHLCERLCDILVVFYRRSLATTSTILTDTAAGVDVDARR